MHYLIIWICRVFYLSTILLIFYPWDSLTPWVVAWRPKPLLEPMLIYHQRCLWHSPKSNYPRSVHELTVYPKKYAHGFVVLCFVVVMQSFIMNSHEVFIHIHQGCFAGTGAIVRLSQCQWNKPDGYGKISQCITTTKHSKAKTVCIFLGIYCINPWHVFGNDIFNPANIVRNKLVIITYLLRSL